MTESETEEEANEVPSRRSQRENKGKLPTQYEDYIMLTKNEEPNNLKEAQKSPNRRKMVPSNGRGIELNQGK